NLALCKSQKLPSLKASRSQNYSVRRKKAEQRSAAQGLAGTRFTDYRERSSGGYLVADSVHYGRRSSAAVERNAEISRFDERRDARLWDRRSRTRRLRIGIELPWRQVGAPGSGGA